MNSRQISSPTRSRDKVLQSLYESEVGGAALKELIKNRPKEKDNIFFSNSLARRPKVFKRSR